MLREYPAAPHIDRPFPLVQEVTKQSWDDGCLDRLKVRCGLGWVRKSSCGLNYNPHVTTVESWWFWLINICSQLGIKCVNQTYSTSIPYIPMFMNFWGIISLFLTKLDKNIKIIETFLKRFNIYFMIAFLSFLKNAHSSVHVMNTGLYALCWQIDSNRK